jgi:hypothetical protein
MAYSGKIMLSDLFEMDDAAGIGLNIGELIMLMVK